MPSLASALIRLRGATLGLVADATGIRAVNLSVWLRGKEQVISAKRLVGLLQYIGVEGGCLCTDVLHQWQDRGALDDSIAALSAYTPALESTREALLVLAEQAAAEMGGEELLEGLIFHLHDGVASNVASPQGWQRLEAVLSRDLEAGKAPGEIATLLEQHLRTR